MMSLFLLRRRILLEESSDDYSNVGGSIHSLQRQNNEKPALSYSVQLKCEDRTIRENSTSCKRQLRTGSRVILT